jgi:hypothetical protein
MYHGVGVTGGQPAPPASTQQGEYGEMRDGQLCLYDEAWDAVPSCAAWEDAIPGRCWLSENMLDPECQAWGMDNPPPHPVCGDLALLRMIGGEDAQPARDQIMQAPSCSGRTREEEAASKRNLILLASIGAAAAVGVIAYVAVKR